MVPGGPTVQGGGGPGPAGGTVRRVMAAPSDLRADAGASRPSAAARLVHRGSYPVRFGYRWLSAGRRGRPAFLVIGAQKAGTTSLYAQLCTHPSIGAALRKEVHWFDRSHRRGADYRTYFPTRRDLDQRARATGVGITGEATPFLLCHPLAPARVRAMLPDVRLVVLLRDPVARAVSGYHHAVRHGDEDRPIEVALDPDHTEPLGADTDAGWWDGDNPVRRRGYLERGDYASQLSRWFAEFPREQVRVLESGGVADGSAFAETIAFLGLPAAPGVPTAARNVGAYDPSAATDVERRLRTYFAPRNAALADLLGRTFPWT